MIAAALQNIRAFIQRDSWRLLFRKHLLDVRQRPGGGITAWIVYRWAALALLRRAWLNLESVWAASLVITGFVACAVAGLG
jgi:hypothetical protein